MTNEFPDSAHWEDAGEMASMWTQRKDFFRRELLQQDDRCLIKSTCRGCGAVIVGSVANNLLSDEQRHFEHCSTGERLSAAG